MQCEALASVSVGDGGGRPQREPSQVLLHDSDWPAKRNASRSQNLARKGPVEMAGPNLAQARHGRLAFQFPAPAF